MTGVDIHLCTAVQYVELLQAGEDTLQTLLTLLSALATQRHDVSQAGQIPGRFGLIELNTAVKIRNIIITQVDTAFTW